MSYDSKLKEPIGNWAHGRDSFRSLHRRLVYRLCIECGQPLELRVLNLEPICGWGANELSQLGVAEVVGISSSKEVAEAVRRNFPDVFDELLVDDMVRPETSTKQRLDESSFNCLLCVDPLGSCETSALSFALALNQIDAGGWVAFALAKSSAEEEEEDDREFFNLVRGLFHSGILDLKSKDTHRRRLPTDESLGIHAVFIAQKNRDVDGHEFVRMTKHGKDSNRAQVLTTIES